MEDVPSFFFGRGRKRYLDEWVRVWFAMGGKGLERMKIGCAHINIGWTGGVMSKHNKTNR